MDLGNSFGSSSIQSMEIDQSEQAEFRTFVMNWVKQQGKQPVMESGERSGVFADQSDSPFQKKTDSSFVKDGQQGTYDHLPWAAKKIKLPEFFGFDPQGWIKKAELYFEIHGTPPQLRMRLAQLSMVGVAQHWFTIVKEVYDQITWDQFTKELLQRFSGLEIQNPYEQLATIHQVNSIHDYIEDFEYLLSLVPRLPESQALGYFIAGLHDEVKRWVRLHRPQSRLDAMYLAKDVEEMLRPSTIGVSQSRFRYQGIGNGLGSLSRPDFKSPMSRTESKGPIMSRSVDKGLGSRFEPNRPSSTFRSPSVSSTDSSSGEIGIEDLGP